MEQRDGTKQGNDQDLGNEKDMQRDNKMHFNSIHNSLFPLYNQVVLVFTEPQGDDRALACDKVWDQITTSTGFILHEEEEEGRKRKYQ